MISEKFLRLTKPILPALALVFTVLSSFLPYSSELMLGMAAVCLCVYAVPVLLRRESFPGWFRIAVPAAVCLTVILTLILAIGHVLGLVTVIEAINLIIIAISGISC